MEVGAIQRLVLGVVNIAEKIFSILLATMDVGCFLKSWDTYGLSTGVESILNILDEKKS